MRIFYKKTFEKEFLKLLPNQKIRVKETLQLFAIDPFHPFDVKIF